jgi:hypothetical protein
VKALILCGVSFRGPTFTHQSGAAISLQGVGDRRYHIAHRIQTALGTPGCVAGPPRSNWKAKQTLTLNYPGNAQETVQLAWEAWPLAGATEDSELDPTPVALLDGARRHGLLLPACVGPTPRFGTPAPEMVYLRIEWTAELQTHWRIVLRLGAVLPREDNAAVLCTRLMRINRPRAHGDVGRWLTALGVQQAAEWRLEVEMVPPAQADTITRGLFLHHLVRLLVQSGEPSLSRTHFIECFHAQFPATPTTRCVKIHAHAFARDLLAQIARQHGLVVHARMQYPMQPRPFDLTPRDVGRLIDCVVTPKVNGFEAFLLLHSYGTAVIQRSGDIHTWPTASGHIGPVLLEGEVLPVTTGSQRMTFVAYDCLLTPSLAYMTHGRHATRAMALQAVLYMWRQATPPDLCVIRKPAFPLALNPQQAIRRCQDWARATGVPCDGVVFADAQLPGYLVPDRLWKLKDLVALFVCFTKPPTARHPQY